MANFASVFMVPRPFDANSPADILVVCPRLFNPFLSATDESVMGNGGFLAASICGVNVGTAGLGTVNRWPQVGQALVCPAKSASASMSCSQFGHVN